MVIWKVKCSKNFALNLEFCFTFTLSITFQQMFTFSYLFQKQPSRVVLRKRCPENYRIALMPKCDFNKVALQLYWNHSSARVFSCKFAAYFETPFPKNTFRWLLLFLLENILPGSSNYLWNLLFCHFVIKILEKWIWKKKSSCHSELHHKIDSLKGEIF